MNSVLRLSKPPKKPYPVLLCTRGHDKPSHACLHGSLQYPHRNHSKMNEHPPENVHTHKAQRRKKGSANIKLVGIVRFKGQHRPGLWFNLAFRH